MNFKKAIGENNEKTKQPCMREMEQTKDIHEEWNAFMDKEELETKKGEMKVTLTTAMEVSMGKWNRSIVTKRSASCGP